MTQNIAWFGKIEKVIYIFFTILNTFRKIFSNFGYFSIRSTESKVLYKLIKHLPGTEYRTQ